MRRDELWDAIHGYAFALERDPDQLGSAVVDAENEVEKILDEIIEENKDEINKLIYIADNACFTTCSISGDCRGVGHSMCRECSKLQNIKKRTGRFPTPMKII